MVASRKHSYKNVRSIDWLVGSTRKIGQKLSRNDDSCVLDIVSFSSLLLLSLFFVFSFYLIILFFSFFSKIFLIDFSCKRFFCIMYKLTNGKYLCYKEWRGGRSEEKFTSLITDISVISWRIRGDTRENSKMAAICVEFFFFLFLLTFNKILYIYIYICIFNI